MNSNVQFVQTMLKYTYGVVPIVAGLDKFTNLLTEWRLYLSQGFADVLPFDPSTFMIVVGIIEIIAGIIVLVRPKIGSFIVGAWLVCIAFSLIATWSYVDVAVRDLAMAIGAFSLFMITNDKVASSEELG